MSDLLLRWSLGIQDTVSLSKSDPIKLNKLFYLTNLSIGSFSKWFPNARLVLLYNGNDFDNFLAEFNKINTNPTLELIDQSTFQNPYHFIPSGVWWKWIPFRLDINSNEIAIDTDIFCINEPKSWFEWINSDAGILTCAERYKTVNVNTCGDFHKNPILKNKHPFNCGIVGQKSGFDGSKCFYDISKSIRFGETQNSMFITEQGAINLWARSHEIEGKTLFCLNFKTNAWIRDFIYFLSRGISVETVHAVMWYKDIVYELKECFERKIFENQDSQSFLNDLFKSATSLQPLYKHAIGRQFGSDPTFSKEHIDF